MVSVSRGPVTGLTRSPLFTQLPALLLAHLMCVIPKEKTLFNLTASFSPCSLRDATFPEFSGLLNTYFYYPVLVYFPPFYKCQPGQFG